MPTTEASLDPKDQSIADVKRFLQNDREWKRVWAQLEKRRMLLAALAQPSLGGGQPDLDALDLFVEKAQGPLSWRGFWFLAIGTGLIATVVAVVVWLICQVANTEPRLTIQWIEHSPQPLLGFLVYLTHGLTVAGITLGLAFYLAGQSRSYIHEALTAFGRRHAVRMGRLFLYLKLGGLTPEQLAAEKGKLKIQAFIVAFGGHKETSTAFREIKAERQLATSWFKALTSSLGQFASTIGKRSRRSDS